MAISVCGKTLIFVDKAIHVVFTAQTFEQGMCRVLRLELTNGLQYTLPLCEVTGGW